MSYNFEIIGITPILTFFNYQQELEINPQRSKTYLGSYQCTLDSFIDSTQMIPKKPQWNWDEVVETMINFWLKHEDSIRHWKIELESSQENALVIGRIANLECLRAELEQAFEA
ncbi:conserved hypothetical protein [Hyella patelloides LEGE 07179]|uniref:Uncharacterized protein n=1 Tax=Hyella patelloides LEGE 07179 TaxID=945734 RepID=A0A563VYG2_9CYAN|nr:hypothetical protein [Hyella patelloides]VEP16417.1 conserved hypothetical protein [Hyella patelloides LEGE 07179]